MVDKSNSTVTLFAVGDIGPVENSDNFAEFVLPTLKQADLRFGQCEKTYSERSIDKPDPTAPRGPRGRRPVPLNPKLASVWKVAGMDVISMASNHTMDWGGEVLMDSIELFRGMGKHVIGADKDIESARKPAIVERNGVKIAFLGYCSVLAENHEARKGKPGAAPMRAHTFYMREEEPHESFQPGTPQKILTVAHAEDLEALVDDVRKAKEQADVVVLSIHWGVHHLPKHISTYQPVVAHAAIDAGADLILGHHPHCLKAVEVYKGKVCFYSMGNFMLQGGSNDHHNYWEIFYYRVDEECRKPHGKYNFPADDRKTMVAKAVFSKKGVERVSFLPAFINGQAQPAMVDPGDPRFAEIVDYTEWLSDQYPHSFRVEGNEVVVEAAPAGWHRAK